MRGLGEYCSLSLNIVVHASWLVALQLSCSITFVINSTPEGLSFCTHVVGCFWMLWWKILEKHFPFVTILPARCAQPSLHSGGVDSSVSIAVEQKQFISLVM